MSSCRIYITAISSQAGRCGIDAGVPEEVLVKTKDQDPESDQIEKTHKKKKNIRNKNSKQTRLPSPSRPSDNI